MDYNKHNTPIGGMGASARPGDIKRAQRIVQRAMGQLVDDVEVYKDALHEAYWSYDNDERATPDGIIIGEALDKAIALLSVLEGAARLCPNLPNKHSGDHAGL